MAWEGARGAGKAFHYILISPLTSNFSMRRPGPCASPVIRTQPQPKALPTQIPGCIQRQLWITLCTNAKPGPGGFTADLTRPHRHPRDGEKMPGVTIGCNREGEVERKVPHPCKKPRKIASLCIHSRIGRRFQPRRRSHAIFGFGRKAAEKPWTQTGNSAYTAQRPGKATAPRSRPDVDIKIY